MKISCIFTTYNSPKWLEKVLWGLQSQTHSSFEVIIADDGSNEENVAKTHQLMQQCKFPIRHIWQEDNGFQKCRILNKAILAAEHDYLLFTDGDCILRNDFLSQHAHFARPGYFLSGTYVKLPFSTSELIQLDDVTSGRCFDLTWLRRKGLPLSKKSIKLSAKGRLAKLLNSMTPTNANFMGANSSAWKKDILAVNGFDERMQYGGLDRELGVRLKNLGIKAKQIRFSAISLHLDHPRGYRDEHLIKKNKNLRRYNEIHKITQTTHGISQLNDDQE